MLQVLHFSLIEDLHSEFLLISLLRGQVKVSVLCSVSRCTIMAVCGLAFGVIKRPEEENIEATIISRY